ncbi:patatin-like phospholipase [Paramyrothecium foliicola]|nr:patatin-like phospholipase [Paramyrothecium foliicola]
MDSYGVRRRDTTKGPPLRILSLDGGGVRGYSMLIIIQELMHRTFVELEGRAPRRQEIPKPCDHFDLIVGTGTGGLIALMLGRLRLDVETCKELYVRLTRMVFETDKTIAGIPYRSTLFKASKLEEAIRQAVREHTVTETEGKDGSDSRLVNPLSLHPSRHTSNASTVSFSARSPSAQMARPAFSGRGGNPDARLYDARENRTKTAVTAVFQGSPRGCPPVILRSYDSRREPSPEFDCKIWQAGRATCSIGLAFKPIQIGQSIFHDDGVGTFNPAPEALDEAVVNEWPGREVGVFVSVGTGKRPKGSDSNSQMWYEGFLGEFADARRRLVAKIEGCETIHDYMVREHLTKRGVNIENYYRLNVEVGVGEFGMNEWHRLGEISTGTRRFMSREVEQKMVYGISSKLAKILKAKIRFERAAQAEAQGIAHGHVSSPSQSQPYIPGPGPLRVPKDVPGLTKTTPYDDFEPLAIELPGDEPVSFAVPQRNSPLSRSSFESGEDKLPVHPHQPSPPRSSHSSHAPPPPPPKDNDQFVNRYDDSDKLIVTAPTPSQYRYAVGMDKIAITSPDEEPRTMPAQYVAPPPTRIEPPPLPPKTPLPEHQGAQRYRTPAPPYPLEDDEMPPPVNMARKPDYRVRQMAPQPTNNAENVLEGLPETRISNLTSPYLTSVEALAAADIEGIRGGHGIEPVIASRLAELRQSLLRMNAMASASSRQRMNLAAEPRPSSPDVAQQETGLGKILHGQLNFVEAVSEAELARKLRLAQWTMQLSASTSLPFEGLAHDMATLPMEWNTLNKELLRIYIELLSPFKISLDGSTDHKTYFMKYWSPFWLQDPFLLRIILYTSACFAHENGRIHKYCVLQHKIAIHRMLRERIQSHDELATNDATIAGVSQLIMNSWYWGGTDDLHTHMNGLKTLVGLRGGLQQLGQQGFLSKVVLIHDIAIALAHETEPTLYGVGGFEYTEVYFTPLELVFNCPLMAEWPSFVDSASSMDLQISTAHLLDRMRDLLASISNNPGEEAVQIIENKAADILQTIERASTTEAGNIKIEGGRKRGKSDGNTTAKEYLSPSVKTEKLSRAMKMTDCTESKEGIGLSTDGSPLPGFETRQHGGTIQDDMHRCVQVVASIYCRAILTRTPTSVICSEEEFLEAWRKIWKIPFTTWNKTVGLFIWVMLAIVPSGHTSPQARFIRTMFVTAFLKTAVNNWHVALDAVRVGLNLQQWLREGQAGTMRHGGSQGAFGGEKGVEKYGFYLGELP